MADHRRLDGGVRWRLAAHSSRQRRDMDDRTAAGLLHPGHDLPGGAHRGHQVHLEAGLPSGLVVGKGQRGGVVDHHVDPAERLSRAVEEDAELLLVADVARRGVHAHALVLGA